MDSNGILFDTRRLSTGQARRLNLSSKPMATPANYGQLIEEHKVQQDIIGQQMFSPGGPRNFQAFSASSTPPLPTTSSHSYPSHLQTCHFSPTSNDASHLTISPIISAQYAQMVTSASDLSGSYAIDMGFGGMAMQNNHDDFGYDSINTTVWIPSSFHVSGRPFGWIALPELLSGHTCSRRPYYPEFCY
ncbi:hypothetical protein P154DRAFT_285466 [Amniculicola lignicola CBS 123094]|uniref:Uncharacterized protein n=1 Tax=Amniculicola lignicola CBS 123094 TaxID=1392246 RepID=A0A6A5WYE9_9PLEO|nr:hypothetical protein P154DRAFT_285466 [Amniculicola lignicola CBS 123094]